MLRYKDVVLWSIIWICKILLLRLRSEGVSKINYLNTMIQLEPCHPPVIAWYCALSIFSIKVWPLFVRFLNECEECDKPNYNSQNGTEHKSFWTNLNKGSNLWTILQLLWYSNRLLCFLNFLIHVSQTIDYFVE